MQDSARAGPASRGAGNARRPGRARRPLARAGGGCPRHGWRRCWPPGWSPAAQPGQRPRTRPPQASVPRPASRCRRARRSASRARTTPGPRRWLPPSTSRGRALTPCTTSPARTWRCARPWSLPRWNASSPPASLPPPPGRPCAAPAWSASSACRRSPIRPAPRHPPRSAVYLRVYATRVTTTSAGRQVASDGITVELTRSGGRWLVSAVLFY